VSGKLDNTEDNTEETTGADPRAFYTLIEFMPAQHRSSHIKAGNAGSWPHNGAERIYVEGEITRRDLHARWASVIEDTIPGDQLPPGADVRYELPDDALPEVRDPEEEAAAYADWIYDSERDDRATGDR
jgi:hypothetical protein